MLTFTLPSCINCPLVWPFRMSEPIPCHVVSSEARSSRCRWKLRACGLLAYVVAARGRTMHRGGRSRWASHRWLVPRELGRHISVCLIQVYPGHLFTAVRIGLVTLQNRHMALYYKVEWSFFKPVSIVRHLGCFQLLLYVWCWNDPPMR